MSFLVEIVAYNASLTGAFMLPKLHYSEPAYFSSTNSTFESRIVDEDLLEVLYLIDGTLYFL